MISNFNSALDNSSYSSSDYEKFDDYYLDQNKNFPNLISHIETNSAHELKFNFDNRKKLKFAIENFITKDYDEILEIKKTNYFFENYINPTNEEKQIPFNVKKTLTILTESSEFEINELKEAERFQANYVLSTPTNLNHKMNHFKTPGVKSRYSISNWQNSTSGGISTVNMKKSQSRLKNVYELPLMSEQSVCSKSTLKKAEEYLECLKNMEEGESCKEIEFNNGTLNNYLITDQTVGESSYVLKKWMDSGEIQINQVECFDIIGEKFLSEDFLRNKFEGKFRKKENDIDIPERNEKWLTHNGSRIFYLLLVLLFNFIFISFIFFHKNNSYFHMATISCKKLNKDVAPDANWLIPMRKDKYEVVFHKSLADLYN